MTPKISIITVVRNGAATIHDCIESVKEQSYPAEHIIIDGGSTDGTLDIVNNYVSSISKIISEPDNGIYDAMNKGITLANGDVIGILNSDDYYAHSDVLAKVALAFADKYADSCYGDLVYVSGNKGRGTRDEDNYYSRSLKIGRYWKSGEFHSNKFYWGWMPPHPTFFVRRCVYEKHGLYNLKLGSAADYELMLRFLVKHKITSTYIPEVMVKMRSGGVSNISLKNRLRGNYMDGLAWKVNELRPYPWTLLLKPVSKIPQYFKKIPFHSIFFNNFNRI